MDLFVWTKGLEIHLYIVLLPFFPSESTDLPREAQQESALFPHPSME